MSPLIAVDWGTSSLRGARLDAAGRVLEERSSDRGILSVPAGGFAEVFHTHFGDWMAEPEARCLIAGMAGSRQGWLEVPYCACPAGLEDVAARLGWVVPGRIAIVPGLCTEADGMPDVMRGEETQVFGALQLLGLQAGLFVLPGTHSKWARVEAGRMQTFSTAMTGEFYALLRHRSILARGLPENDGTLDAAAFDAGLAQASTGMSLLRSAFAVRTLALFERWPAAALPSYLSGLLIGEELGAQALPDAVVLIGADALTERYERAFAARHVAVRSLGAAATWRGLYSLAAALP